MGWLTTEELWWDDKGQLRTHAPSTYKIPLASDVPPIFNVTLAEWSVNTRADDRPHQGRRRAAADAGDLGGRGAVDGGGVGRRLPRCPRLDTPVTPERVLMGVEQMKRVGRMTAARRFELSSRRIRRRSVAELTAVRGSSPREAGTFMLISPDAMIGTIGGGALEYMVIDRARAGAARWPARRRARYPARPRDRPVLRRPGRGRRCASSTTRLAPSADRAGRSRGGRPAACLSSSAPAMSARRWRGRWRRCRSRSHVDRHAADELTGLPDDVEAKAVADARGGRPLGARTAAASSSSPTTTRSIS